MQTTPAGRPRRMALVATCLIAVAALLMAGCSGESASGDGAFYADKTLTLFVPYSAGGGTDLAARAFAPLLKEHLEGHPTVIVENDPSTGGIVGSNEFARSRKKDGLTVLVSSSALHSAYLVDDPTVKVDFNDLRPILGMATGSLVFVSDDTGMTKPEDITKPAKTPLILAGQVPSGSDLRTLLALDLLGADYQAIFGYEGSGDKRIAFERGEVNLMLDNSISYRQQMQSFADKGEVVPLFSQGLMNGDTLERIASMPDLPTPTELYEKANGKPATGKEWDAYRTLVASTDSLSKAMWLHKDDPDAAYDSLTKAFAEIIADKDAMAKLGDDVFGGNPPLTGEKLTEVVNTMANPDPDARQYLRDYLTDRWQVKF
jgi:tripartite-type tricarboxylate transporter receptor subunit TctC